MWEYQMKQTDSSWGSHSDHLGCTQSPLILRCTDLGIGPHSCHVQEFKVSVWREKNAHLNPHLKNNQKRHTCLLP